MKHNFLKIDIDGHNINALLDTGATVSVISWSLCLKLKKVLTPTTGSALQGAGRSRLHHWGCALPGSQSAVPCSQLLLLF